MTQPTRLEIGTISFARCGPKMVLPPRERTRLILAAADTYRPDLLITAGYAVHSLKHLHPLARQYRLLGHSGTVITEVHHETPKSDDESPHAMWAIDPRGLMHRFGRQMFSTAAEVRKAGSTAQDQFEAQRLDRVFAVGPFTVFALVCGEINVVLGREEPRFAFPEAYETIVAADIIINPTHDRMSNAGTLHAKRVFLSQRSPDDRDRVYVSCSNWEACDLNGRVQWPSPTLHTVYRSGKALDYEEKADGAFGFVYRTWSLGLATKPLETVLCRDCSVLVSLLETLSEHAQ